MLTRNLASRLVVGCLAALLLSVPAHSAECEPSQDPSPEGTEATGINFHNQTSYAMRVFWVGFDGFLEPYGDWIQPGETYSLSTFIGHGWFVEVKTPEGPVCSGRIFATDTEACQAGILYDNGIGYDVGFCDFIP